MISSYVSGFAVTKYCTLELHHYNTVYSFSLDKIKQFAEFRYIKNIETLSAAGGCAPDPCFCLFNTAVGTLFKKSWLRP